MNPLQARYPEAFEYLRARGIEPSADFYDRVEAARKQAWTMSKLSDLEHIGRIKASLEKAIAEGMSFENWRKENLADLQGLPKSYQETVFRTTVLSSYNAGRWAHFRDHAERRPILRYTAINDSRTRPAHRALHGLMMPVDDPRWQTLAAPNGFNCFLPGTTVRGAFELGLKSRYTGEAVEITARTGDRLTVTANHPVLTRRGWLPAHQVKEGDYLLAYGGVVNPQLERVFNDQYPPSPVEDVFETLRANGFGIADIAAFQFHGDAHLRESEVHVAGRDAHLIARMQTAGVHGIKQFHLVGAGAYLPGQLAGDSAAQFDMAQRLLFADDAANVAARTANSLCHTTLAAFKYIAVFIKDAFTQGARLFTRRIPRGGQLALRAAGSGFDGEPLDGLRFALTAPCNTMRQQALPDNLTADAMPLGETVFTLPGNIGFDDAVYDRIRQDTTGFAETAVVGVRRFHYSGYVYDFQTKNGLIVAGNIVVHNCRCTLMSLSEQQAKGMGYTGTPQDIPTWTDKHGVEHTAAPDKGWNHSPEHDLTDLLREREQRLNMNAAVYDSGDAPPSPEPWHPPLPTAGNAFEEARYDVVTRGQQDGLEHGRVVDANGQVIDTRQGKEQAISYQDIINLLPGTTLYHNHPSNMGLSMADIEFAGQAGLASVVAFGTTQEAAYSVSILSGWSEMYAAIYDAKKIVRQKVSRLFLSGKINEGEAAAMYAHIMALRLSDQGLITYKIAPASKEMADLINRYAAEIEQWRKETK